MQPDDPRIDYGREPEGDDPSIEEGWARHELARAAELAARLGGHPEKAEEVERGLLQVAGLEGFDLAA